MTEDLRPLEEVQDVSEATVPPEKLRFLQNSMDKARASAANLMGLLIVGGFVATAVLSVVTGLWGGRLKLVEICDLLKAIATTFGTPLGFVLGYYYGVAKK